MAFLQFTATPLIDLLLYVSTENYNSTTSSAYTAVLPWYANYTVPPKLRDLARKRTAHMGLSSLDVDTTDRGASTSGPGTTSSDYEAAKRAAGIPTGQPKSLNMGRKTGLGGLLSAPVYAARFRLDVFSNELLEPLSDLLGDKRYLFEGKHPSSLDCLAFGYLSLLFYPAVPQPWLREIMQSKYPRIVTYIHRLRQQFLNDDEGRPSNASSVSISSIASSRKRANTSLPWRQNSKPLISTTLDCVREIVGNFPVFSYFMQRDILVQSEVSDSSKRPISALPSPFFTKALLGMSTLFALSTAAIAIHHRKSPRQSELIFWALRPRSGMGEAGNLLSVLANQLPRGAY